MMKCKYCAGHVRWMGSSDALTHTECEACGAQNSHDILEFFQDMSIFGEKSSTPRGVDTSLNQAQSSMLGRISYSNPP